MPTRMLRDSFVTSESVASLPPDSQDRLPRYFLLADDYGCFQVHPAVIHGRIFPLRPDVTFEIIERDLVAYAGADIIRFYGGDDGKKYAWFPNWLLSQRVPRVSAKRKFPEPPATASYASVPTANSGSRSPPKPAEAGLNRSVRPSQAQAQSSDPQSQSQSQAQAQSGIGAAGGVDPPLLAELHEILARPLLEPNDPEWGNFVARTLGIPRAQCDTAVREFLSRRPGPGEYGPAYVLRMIQAGAGGSRKVIQLPEMVPKWRQTGFKTELEWLESRFRSWNDLPIGVTLPDGWENTARAQFAVGNAS